jgi:hypothetical protein
MTTRPTTLSQIAERSESLADFGQQLRDWLHDLRRVSSRPQVIKAVTGKPRSLAKRFADGAVADAWLGAYAEHLSTAAGTSPPAWAFERDRIAPEPWFADEGSSALLRAAALRQSPLPFKRRNLYPYTVELPFRLQAGRPATSGSEKRQVNAERQRRFRKRRQAELIGLRKLAARWGAAPRPI